MGFECYDGGMSFERDVEGDFKVQNLLCQPSINHELLIAQVSFFSHNFIFSLFMFNIIFLISSFKYNFFKLIANWMF